MRGFLFLVVGEGRRVDVDDGAVGHLGGLGVVSRMALTVVRADAPQMLARHIAVRERLGEAFAHHPASLSFINSKSPATDSALAADASRGSIAWIALSMAATWERLDLGTLARTCGRNAPCSAGI